MAAGAMRAACSGWMTELPNVLLFMPDQLRADGVGAFGNPVVRTPKIDALAERGVRFTNACSQHRVCAQSRISMFTGWYPHVAGHRPLEHLLDRSIAAPLERAG
jgi:arylsulfatase A-like enzyme